MRLFSIRYKIVLCIFIFIFIQHSYAEFDRFETQAVETPTQTITVGEPEATTEPEPASEPEPEPASDIQLDGVATPVGGMDLSSARISGEPNSICSGKAAEAASSVLRMGYEAMDTLNGCLLDTANAGEKIASADLSTEKLCTGAIFWASKAVSKVDGTGLLKPETIAALREANEKRRAHEARSGEKARLTAEQRITLLADDGVVDDKAAARIGKWVGVRGLNNAVTGFIGMRYALSARALGGMSIGTAALLNGAGPAYQQYEQAICSEAALPVRRTERGECEIDHKLTKDLADLILNKKQFEEVVERNPYACVFLNRMVADLYRTLLAAFPELKTYHNIQLSNRDIYCSPESTEYSLLLTSRGTTNVKEYRLIRQSGQLVIRSASDQVFKELAIEVVSTPDSYTLGDMSVIPVQSATPLTITREQAESQKMNFLSRKAFESAKSLDSLDRFFFGPMVKGCCAQERSDLRDAAGCPSIGATRQ